VIVGSKASSGSRFVQGEAVDHVAHQRRAPNHMVFCTTKSIPSRISATYSGCSLVIEKSAGYHNVSGWIDEFRYCRGVFQKSRATYCIPFERIRLAS
jgi:hypothetical protein